MDNKKIAETFERSVEWYRKEYGKDRGELVCAVETNYADKVAELIAKGTSVKGFYLESHTLLGHHVYNLTMYADRYVQNQDYAANRDRITELLLGAGSDPNGVTDWKYTPLMNACWGFIEGSTGPGWKEKHMRVLEKILKRLVAAGADPDPNMADRFGRTLYSIFPKVEDILWKQESQKRLLWIIEDVEMDASYIACLFAPFFDAVLVSDDCASPHSESDTPVHGAQDSASLISGGGFGKIVALMDRNLSSGSGFDFLAETLGKTATEAKLCLVFNSNDVPRTAIPVDAIKEVAASSGRQIAEFYCQPDLCGEESFIRKLYDTALSAGKATGSPVAWVGDFQGNLLVPRKFRNVGSEKGACDYEVMRRLALGLGKPELPECLRSTLTLDDLVAIADGGAPQKRILRAEEVVRNEHDAADVLLCTAPLPDAIMMRAIDLCARPGGPTAGIAMLARAEKALSDTVVKRLFEEMLRQSHTGALHGLVERRGVDMLPQALRDELLKEYGIHAREGGELLDASKLLKRPVPAKPEAGKQETGKGKIRR